MKISRCRYNRFFSTKIKSDEKVKNRDNRLERIKFLIQQIIKTKDRLRDTALMNFMTWKLSLVIWQVAIILSIKNLNYIKPSNWSD